jgi:hypothetical protein
MEQDTLRRLIRNKLAGGNLPRGPLGAVSQTYGSHEPRLRRASRRFAECHSIPLEFALRERATPNSVAQE